MYEIDREIAIRNFFFAMKGASSSYRCKRKRQGMEDEDKRLEAELDALIRMDEAVFRGLHASVQENYIHGHVSSREMRIHEGMFLRLVLGFYE